MGLQWRVVLDALGEASGRKRDSNTAPVPIRPVSRRLLKEPGPSVCRELLQPERVEAEPSTSPPRWGFVPGLGSVSGCLLSPARGQGPAQGCRFLPPACANPAALGSRGAASVGLAGVRAARGKPRPLRLPHASLPSEVRPPRRGQGLLGGFPFWKPWGLDTGAGERRARQERGRGGDSHTPWDGDRRVLQVTGSCSVRALRASPSTHTALLQPLDPCGLPPPGDGCPPTKGFPVATAPSCHSLSPTVLTQPLW